MLGLTVRHEEWRSQGIELPIFQLVDFSYSQPQTEEAHHSQASTSLNGLNHCCMNVL